MNRVARRRHFIVTVMLALVLVATVGSVVVESTVCIGRWMVTLRGMCIYAWCEPPAMHAGQSGISTGWYGVRCAYESFQQFGRYYLQLPLWPLAFVAGAACLWLILRWPKTPYGHCQRCGYCLTGNTTGRCPECGASTAAAAGAPHRAWRRWAMRWLWSGMRHVGGAATDRTLSSDTAATAIRLGLIVVWHWTLIPATQGLLYQVLLPDWRPERTDWLVAPTFDPWRIFDPCLVPITSVALLAMVVAEALLGCLAYLRTAPKRELTFGRYVRAWWRACLWGTLLVPTLCVPVAILTQERDAAMRSVALWVIMVPVLVWIRGSNEGTPAPGSDPR